MLTESLHPKFRVSRDFGSPNARNHANLGVPFRVRFQSLLGLTFALDLILASLIESNEFFEPVAF